MRTDEQLRALFNQTFDSLPPAVRSKIEDLWRREGIPSEAADGAGRLRPPILKEPVILNRNRRRPPVQNISGPQSPISQTIAAGRLGAQMIADSRGICGQTDGLVFHFKASVVDEATDENLKSVIAHELAHTYRAAEAGRPFPEAAFILQTSEDQEEEKANALMAQWKFDRGALLSWLQQNAARLGL